MLAISTQIQQKLQAIFKELEKIIFLEFDWFN